MILVASPPGRAKTVAVLNFTLEALLAGAIQGVAEDLGCRGLVFNLQSQSRSNGARTLMPVHHIVRDRGWLVVGWSDDPIKTEKYFSKVP